MPARSRKAPTPSPRPPIRKPPPPPAPPGFPAFLAAYNRAMFPEGGKGYSQTSGDGQRMARSYAAVLAGGRWTLTDLLVAVQEARRRAPRWRGVFWHNVFWPHVEELIIEGRRRNGGLFPARALDADPGFGGPAGGDDEETRLRALARSMEGRPGVLRTGEDLVNWLRNVTMESLTRRYETHWAQRRAQEGGTA